MRSANPWTIVGLLSLSFLSSALADEKTAARFLDRGEYIEDTKTGLLWQKDGEASGKLNFNQAAEYAQKLKLGKLDGWRVPTAAEYAGIFPAAEEPFKNSGYTPEMCCGGGKEFRSYWTSELDGPPERDYAYVYHWYNKGGKNNCFASKNFVYVRCVRDKTAGADLAEVRGLTKREDIPGDKLELAKRLVKDLADDDFNRREAAHSELKSLGAVIHAYLREVLNETKDAEVRTRLKQLLN